ncbi:MAG: hypothetical protein ABMB14_21455 [Myxococcota bacterium]
MIGLWAGAAFAADAILGLKVTGPTGSVLLDDELVLPSERIVPGPDGKHSLGVYTTKFDHTKALVELVAGKVKDGKPIAKVTASFEVGPYAPATQELVYKKSTWKIEAVLGDVWSAPEPASTAPSTDRFALVWDDAEQVVDPTVTNPKKRVVVKERELPEGRTQPLAQASPVKVLAAQGERTIQIETIPVPAPTEHCQVGGATAEPTPTPYFVALGDFVPRVTTREVATRFPDGTGYRVAAGVPVVAEGEGTWRVNTGGLSFLIQATEEDIAFYYRPSTHFSGGVDGTTGGESPLSLPAGAIGKTNLGDVSWAGPDPLPIVGMRGVWAPVAVVRVPCAEVRLAPDTAAMVNATGK